MILYRIIYFLIAIISMLTLPYLDYKDNNLGQETYKDFLKFIRFSSYIWYFVGGIIWPLTLFLEIVPYFIRKAGK